MVAFSIIPHISILSRNNTVFVGFIGMYKLFIVGFMDKSVETANKLLGRHIRSLRIAKGWTQQELGNQADVNYKFLGEIERGQQNPSFQILVKIADALGVELSELFKIDQEISDRKEIEKRINEIVKDLPDDALRQVFLLIKTLHPIL